MDTYKQGIDEDFCIAGFRRWDSERCEVERCLLVTEGSLVPGAVLWWGLGDLGSGSRMGATERWERGVLAASCLAFDSVFGSVHILKK